MFQISKKIIHQACTSKELKLSVIFLHSFFCFEKDQIFDISKIRFSDIRFFFI